MGRLAALMAVGVALFSARAGAATVDRTDPMGKLSAAVLAQVNQVWSYTGHDGRFLSVAKSYTMLRACKPPGLCLQVMTDLAGRTVALASEEDLQMARSDEVGALSTAVEVLGTGRLDTESLRGLTLLAIRDRRPQKTNLGGRCLAVAERGAIIITIVSRSACSK